MATSPPASPSLASASSGSCAYPYHSPRLAPTYQAIVPPTAELTRATSQLGNYSPRLIWRRDCVPPARVQRYLNDARIKAGFIADEQALLTLLDANNYDIDAALNAVSTSRPFLWEDDQPDFSWANTWMRKVIECGSSLTELESGLKALSETKDNTIDRRLVKRCTELRDRAMEFSVQVRDASTNSNQPLGISRLRNIIQNYAGSFGPNIDTPALQVALNALHASKHAKRRLNNCAGLDRLRKQGHEMSHDEAVRLQNLVRDRASFVAIPNMQQLDTAIAQTNQILSKTNSNNNVATPLSVYQHRQSPSQEPHHPSEARRKWNEAVARRGSSRLKYAELQQLASELDQDDAKEAASVLAAIDQARQQLIDAYRVNPNEVSVSTCVEHLRELSQTICCVTEEEVALMNLVKNTETFMERLKVLHSKYQHGQTIPIATIEQMIALMSSSRMVKLPWTGDEKTCPVTWLRNVRAFAVWVEERVKDPQLSAKTASELLSRLRVARISMPQVQGVCETVLKTSNAARTTPTNPQVQFLMHQLHQVASGSFRPTVSALMGLLTSLSRVASPQYDVASSGEVSMAQAILQRGLQWVDQAQTMLNQAQHDGQIRKHILDAQQLPLDLSEYISKLETRIFETNWLKRVVNKNDIYSQLELYREAEKRCSPRIQNTVQVLRQHLVASFQWLEKVQKQLGPFFLDDLRFNFKNPLQAQDGTSVPTTSPIITKPHECPCRRWARAPNSVIVCTACSKSFHRSCLGFSPASEVAAPSNFICMDCSRKSSSSYLYADHYPPISGQLEYGPRGLSLSQLEELSATMPTNLVCPQKDAFLSLLKRAKSWASLVQEAIGSNFATIDHLVDLYRDGEDIRVEVKERQRLAEMIHSMRRKSSMVASVEPTSTPVIVLDDDAQSSESSETWSMTNGMKNKGEPNLGVLTTRTPSPSAEPRA